MLNNWKILIIYYYYDQLKLSIRFKQIARIKTTKLYDDATIESKKAMFQWEYDSYS